MFGYTVTLPGHGGGAFIAGSSGRVLDSVISDNHADTGGGGLFSYQGAVDVEATHIISNTSGNIGGGVYLFSSAATLKGNTISHNATLNFGGGVDVASCSPTFYANVIADNSAKKGGGIYLWYSHSLLVNSALLDNEASDSGSGLWVGGSNPQAVHITMARNSGGDGSGVFVGDANTSHSTLAMTNTVMSSHAVGVSIAATNTVTLDGVLWYGTPLTVSTAGGATLSVQHQVTGNPQFGSDGYHITSASAAIDAGVPAGVLTDIDNQPRFGVPDLGADEYWAPGSLKYVYMPVVMHNK